MNDDGVPIIGDQARRTMFCDICQQTRPGNLIATTKICIDMTGRPCPKELGVGVQILKLCRDNARCINQASEWAGKRPIMPKTGDVLDVVDREGRRGACIVLSVWPCRTPGKPPAISLVGVDPDPLNHKQTGAPWQVWDRIPHASAVAKDGEDWEHLVSGLPGPFWVEPKDEAAQLRREVAEHGRARNRAEVRNEAGGKRLDQLVAQVRKHGVGTGKAGRDDLAYAIQAISDDLEDTAAGGTVAENITPIGKTREDDDGNGAS